MMFDVFHTTKMGKKVWDDPPWCWIHPAQVEMNISISQYLTLQSHNQPSPPLKTTTFFSTPAAFPDLFVQEKCQQKWLSNFRSQAESIFHAVCSVLRPANGINIFLSGFFRGCDSLKKQWIILRLLFFVFWSFLKGYIAEIIGSAEASSFFFGTFEWKPFKKHRGSSRFRDLLAKIGRKTIGKFVWKKWAGPPPNRLPNSCLTCPKVRRAWWSAAKRSTVFPYAIYHLTFVGTR